jgi:hypothetical protein
MMSRSVAGGSDVMVARRPRSRTARIASTAPAGTALAAASTPPWLSARTPVGGQLDEHAPGDPAGAVHQDGLAGPDAERGADRLVGGERRDRQRRRGVERHSWRYRGHVLSGGDAALGPGALLAQRKRMRGHPVAQSDAVHPIPDANDQSGRFYTQGHRRAGPQIPVPGPGELVPVAHPGRPHVDEHLVWPQRPRRGQVEEFDRCAELAYARCLHDSLPFFLPIFSREDPGVAAGDRAGRQ